MEVAIGGPAALRWGFGTWSTNAMAWKLALEIAPNTFLLGHELELVLGMRAITQQHSIRVRKSEIP